MFSLDDTIAAVATPQGRGGLGVIRVSGPSARQVTARLLDRSKPLSPRRATHARAILEDGRRALDEVIVTYFPGPRSYTGQDVVEISAHGSPVVLRQILSRALQAGARLAEPGEFTLRAFLTGRIDLVQAEAVNDLVDAVTPLQARAAFDQLEGTLTNAIREIDERLFDLVARLEACVDFPDEGFHFVSAEEIAAGLGDIERRVGALVAQAARGRLVREGVQVVIAGKPNVGKSSLFNHLLGAPRAIVSDQPGTTRDLVGDLMDLDGIRMHLVDSAGIQETADRVEAEGVARARGAMSVASLLLVVLDRSREFDRSDSDLLQLTRSRPRLLIVNKCDLGPQWEADRLPDQERIIEVSLKTGQGTPEIPAAMAEVLGSTDILRDCPAVTNTRHIELLGRADRSIGRARNAAAASPPASEEFILADLQDARSAIEEITGQRTSDDVLRHIFERFCIGK